MFWTEIKQFLHPTTDFIKIITEIAKATTGNETNIALSIEKAIELFPQREETKHMTIITDALPTIGKEPEKETLEAVGKAATSGITISVIGINLDEKGKELAKRMVEIGKGKVYIVKDVDELDTIVLEDYYSIM